MKGPGALFRLVKRRFLRWTKSRDEIDRLEAVGHPLAGPLARALRGTLSPAASAEEQDWIDRLEALRQKTNRSEEPLPVRELVPEGRGPILEEITVGQASRVGSKSAEWCRMLFRLLREARPATCLEMGTNVGISASYQAAALSLNGMGRLVTIEGQPDRADAAKRHVESIGLTDVAFVSGPFEAVLQGVLEEHGPFGYVFVDGHHDGPATVAYSHQLTDHLTAPALVVFDDIDWTEGMRRAWKEIAEDQRWSLVVDLYKLGLTVYDPSAETRSVHRIAIR